jgi:hypothetical protein
MRVQDTPMCFVTLANKISCDPWRRRFHGGFHGGRFRSGSRLLGRRHIITWHAVPYEQAKRQDGGRHQKQPDHPSSTGDHGKQRFRWIGVQLVTIMKTSLTW